MSDVATASVMATDKDDELDTFIQFRCDTPFKEWVRRAARLKRIKPAQYIRMTLDAAMRAEGVPLTEPEEEPAPKKKPRKPN